MPYKPKFCCQCAEKIDRIDWKPWTSRRFCELCETELGIYDKLHWGLLGIGLLFGLFGIGTYLQKPEKQLNVAPNQFAVSNVRNDGLLPKNAAQVSTNSSVPNQAQANNFPPQTKPPQLPVELKTKPTRPQAAEITEKVYFCGAPTKKGTLCSRRVKNGGRCWQHEGQAAMLSQEKLIAVQ